MDRKKIVLIRALWIISQIIILSLAAECLIGFFSKDMTTVIPRSYAWNDGGFLWHQPSVQTKMLTPEKFNWSLSYNSFGMRDRARDVKKPNEFRVAVLGDSYVEDLQLEDDRTVTRLLENKLQDQTEVLNFGMTGIGTIESYLIYEKIAQPLDPDLVVLFFYVGNDVRNNSPELESIRNNLSINRQMQLRPYLVQKDSGYEFQVPKFPKNSDREGSAVKVSRWLLTHSSLYRLIHDSLGLSSFKNCPISPLPQKAQEQLPYKGRNLSAGVFLDPGPEMWEDAWKTTFAAIGKLSAKVKSDGHRFLLVVVPYAFDLERDARENALRFAFNDHGDCQKHFMLSDLNYQVQFPPDLQPVELPKNFDFDSPSKRLKEYAHNNQIDLVDLTSLFRSRSAEGKKDFWNWDRHWTVDGAEAAAEALVPTIKQLKKSRSPQVFVK